MSDVTRILSAIEQGDPSAAEQLLPLVYDELRQLAAQKLAKERPGQTLQATALVHEAYLRLIQPGEATPQNRAQLFGMAGRLMREILVDHARRKDARKRGGAVTKVSLHESVAAPEIAIVDLLALDEALSELNSRDVRLCQVVELRFFAGLSIDEAAEALHVSTATVQRDWTVARAWLHQRLS
jgi:RNA polymerase sigma factor (TIGR02999 family)